MKTLTKKAGEFRAVCRLTQARPEAKLSPEERREAKEKGYARRLNRDLSKPRWEILFPGCEGFETTDRDVFEQHMREHHGRTPGKVMAGMRGSLPAWPTPSELSRPWRGPKLVDEGAPFKSRDDVTETCPACGLVSELPGNSAAELWWREHLERCTGVASEAGAA